MNRLYYLLFCLLFIACKNKQRPMHPHPRVMVTKHTIGIIPFKGTDTILAKEIKNGLEKIMDAEVTVLEEYTLPSFAFYKPRNRYIADSLLDFLDDCNDGRFEKIIGITAGDISTRKEPHENWGVMGLGNMPGISCVISSYRVKPTVKDRSHFVKRMTVLAMHELGHTFDLRHCDSDPCLMRDAEGKMNLDDTESYCNECSKWLTGLGVLRQQ